MEQEKKQFDVKALIEKGKAKGSLSNAEIMEALEFADYDIEQIEKLYETLENMGYTVDTLGLKKDDNGKIEDANVVLLPVPTTRDKINIFCLIRLTLVGVCGKM